MTNKSDSSGTNDTSSEVNISLDNLQWTYTGLLDDVMIRYADEYVSEEFFNKMILKNIFFSGGIFINDGYLVNHPIARQSLRDENSLLRVMLDVGFVRILTRASSSEALSRMPITMAEQGNESFQQLVNSNDWNELAPILRLIAQAAFRTNTVRLWPDRDMSVGFTTLMRDRAFAEEEPLNLGLANVSRDEWLRIRDDFLSREPEVSGARDKLEKAALNTFVDTRSDLRAAMNDVMTIGNQAYHYNFGLALTAEEENGVAVDTTIGSAFDELLQTRQVQRGQLDNIPLLRLPSDLPYNRGDLFLSFLRPTTDVGQAKVSYLSSLRNIILSTSSDFESLRSDLLSSTNIYINRIIELLSPTFGRFELERSFEESITLAVGSLSSQQGSERVSATAAPTAGLAISIQDRINQMGRQFLVERFQIRDVSEEFNPDEQVIRLGDIRPQIASLAFDKEAAATFSENIPPAPKF